MFVCLPFCFFVSSHILHLLHLLCFFIFFLLEFLVLFILHIDKCWRWHSLQNYTNKSSFHSHRARPPNPFAQIHESLCECVCLSVCVNEICNTNEWGGYLSNGFLSQNRDVFIHLIVFVLGRTCLHIGVVWVSVQCILFVECGCVFCLFGIWLEEIGSFTPCVFCIAKILWCEKLLHIFRRLQFRNIIAYYAAFEWFQIRSTVW